MRKALSFAVMIALSIGGLAQNPAQEDPPPKTQVSSEPDRVNGFSEASADKALRQLKAGLEGRNENQVQSVFDPEQMEGYLEFQDQVGAFIRHYDPIRVFYRVAQTSAEGGKGIALVEMQMEAAPSDGNGTSVRREQQVHFEFVRGKNGWRIVAVTPREFFAP